MALEAWLRDQRAKLSAKSETAKAITYCLTRWTAFTRFCEFRFNPAGYSDLMPATIPI